MTTFLPKPAPAELAAKVHAAYGFTPGGGELAELARKRLEAVDPTRTLDDVIRRLFDRDQYTVSAFGASL